MPAYVEVYGLTNERNSHTIESFLAEYIDRNQCEDRKNEDLMILKLDRHDVPPGKDDSDDYEWEPATTLTHTIERGLDYPRRCFYVCYPSNHPDIDFAWLQFTTDDKLVLGLSIPQPSDPVLRLSKSFLHHMQEHQHCHLGMITDETSPPYPTNEEEFRQQMASLDNLLNRDLPS